MVASLAAAALLRRPLRTLLTALGIAIAVASTVVVLSLGEGMRRAFAQEMGSVGPDLQVSFGAFDANLFGAVPELATGYVDTLREASSRYGIASVTPVLVHLRSGLTPGSGIIFQGLPAASGPRLRDATPPGMPWRLPHGRHLRRCPTGPPPSRSASTDARKPHC